MNFPTRQQMEIELNDDQPHDFFITIHTKNNDILAMAYLEQKKMYHARKESNRLMKQVKGAVDSVIIGRTAATKEFFEKNEALVNFVREEGVTFKNVIR